MIMKETADFTTKTCYVKLLLKGKCPASTVVCKASYCRQLLNKNATRKNSAAVEATEANFLPDQTATEPEEAEKPDFHLGFFKFHQNCMHGSSNAVADDQNNDIATWSSSRSSKRDLIKKKCITCAKLGVTCMYDLEQQNRKPFWVEARSHFNSRGNMPNSNKSLSPDVFEGPKMYPETWRNMNMKGYAHFECNKVMRRDEFASHYMFMHNLIFESQPKRCPMWSQGCTFTRSRLHTLNGLSLKFDRAVCGPAVVGSRDSVESTEFDSERCSHEDLSILNSLPEHLMCYILDRLDSYSLRLLSQTNRKIRYFVLSYVEQKNRGIFLNDWNPSKDSRSNVSGNISWQICFFSADDSEAQIETPLADLTFSNECFVSPKNSVANVTRQHYAVSVDRMIDTVSLVNPQISRFCNLSKSSSNNVAVVDHLKDCKFAIDIATYTEHKHYDSTLGRIELQPMRIALT